MITRTPLAACLNCHHPLNALGNTHPEDENEKPEPGCIIICMACGGVMKLSEKMTPEGFDDQEIDEIINDHDLMAHLAQTATKIHIIKRMVN